jgi:hypothetical protein
VPHPEVGSRPMNKDERMGVAGAADLNGAQDTTR